MASLKRYAVLSIVSALITIFLKTSAYYLTGSVGLLSDAMESIVNLIGAVMAFAMLTIASRPADEDHPYGHTKAEYFSSGVEGTLIIVAAISIGVAAIHRLIEPKPLEQIGIGMAVSAVASLVNLLAAITLLRAGKKHRSITLEANARHLLTDVWTSVGVISGVTISWLSGYNELDSVVAIAVAVHILYSGVVIVNKSIHGLMDTAGSPEDQKTIETILVSFQQEGMAWHALRTRQAGSRLFISFHVLVPGAWTVAKGHDLLEKIETTIVEKLPYATTFTHLEPIEDHACWKDDFNTGHHEMY